MLSNEKSREFIALVGAAAAPRAFAARRRHIAKDRQMLFRIGISLGDVMIEETTSLSLPKSLSSRVSMVD